MMVRACISRTMLGAALDALAEAGTYLAENAERAAQRRDVIGSSPELQVRERAKLAALSAAISRALRQRGVAPRTAKPVAELATIAFANAYELWVEADGRVSVSDCLEAAVAAFRTALATVPTIGTRRRRTRHLLAGCLFRT